MSTDLTAPCPVCTADVPLVDGQLVTHRHRDQFGPCPAGQVEPTPDVLITDPVERADRFVRHVAERWTGDPENHFGVFVAEYDRMRAELSRTVADCGICRLGGRTIQINDDCPRHGDTDGEA